MIYVLPDGATLIVAYKRHECSAGRAPPSGKLLFCNLLGNVRILIAHSKHNLRFRRRLHLPLAHRRIDDRNPANGYRTTMRPVRFQRLAPVLALPAPRRTVQSDRLSSGISMPWGRFKREGENISGFIFPAAC